MRIRGSTNRRVRDPRRIAGRRELLGAVAVLVVALIVYISYTANSGLPFSSGYRVNIALRDAQRLTAHDDVRVHGVRVGQVVSVQAEAPTRGMPAYTRAKLSLSGSVAPLPLDTTAQVLSASVLGASYLELAPGSSRTKIPSGGSLPLANVRPTVQLSDLLGMFDRSTAQSLQRTLAATAYGFAGRGPAINAGLGSLATLLPLAQGVSATLASPAAQLSRLLSGYDAFASALAPVRSAVADLIGSGSVTLAAIGRELGPLAATIELLAPTELTTTTALNAVQPSLDGLATAATELRPAADQIPSTVTRLDSALEAGTTALTGVPDFARRLGGSLDSLRALSLEPSTSGALRKLDTAVGSSAITIGTLAAAQIHCDIVPLWAQGFASGFGGMGFGLGPGMATVGLTSLGALGEMFQNGTPSPNVAIDNTPTENFNQCEAGNEPYSGRQILTPDVPQLLSGHTRPTFQPPGVHQLAEQAGLEGGPVR
jgi:phospholipid/cholesterol/gamma-HCH transport system substrate-binding protein